MRKIPAIIGFSAVLLSSIAFAETAPLQSTAPSDGAIRAGLQKYFGDKLPQLDAKCKAMLGPENGLDGNIQKCFSALKSKPAKGGMQAMASSGGCNCMDGFGGHGVWVDLDFLGGFCDGTHKC